MSGWRSGYAPADGAELDLLPGEFQDEERPAASARTPHAASRTGALVALSLVALGLLLVAGAWIGEQRWHPRSSSLKSVEVKQARKDEYVLTEPQELVRAVDASIQNNKEEVELSEAFSRVPSTDQSLGEEESQYSSYEWEVTFAGSARVRKEQDIQAEVLAMKPFGTIVVGRRAGDNWLALVHEPGYMAITTEQGVEVLKRRSVLYSRVLRGACKDVSKHPIWDADTCQNAGFALGYFDSTIGIYNGELDRPEGCYEYRGQLWVSTNHKHRGNGAIGDRKPICSSNIYPTTTTTTATTTTITRTSTTRTITTTTPPTPDRAAVMATWDFPSLFCIEVVRTHGYELPLVRAQQRVQASIFSCDEYRVFSDGGKTEVIGVAPDGTEIRTIVIPPIKKQMGDLSDKGVTTNSWLNTETFLQVWHLARAEDGRLLDHDWVVKVDPDAVFFPARLRHILRPWTHPGVSKYVMNCDRWKPKIALYGSLEIFSHKAMKTYLEKENDCRKKLHWHGWGEDYYMSHCMDHLKVGHINDFSLIGDARCHYAACDVTSKVVYHDYKNQTAWFACWHLSRRTERHE